MRRSTFVSDTDDGLKFILADVLKAGLPVGIRHRDMPEIWGAFDAYLAMFIAIFRKLRTDESHTRITIVVVNKWVEFLSLGWLLLTVL